MKRVCIVTPGYLSSTPRVVREADALSAAGFDVRVAFTQGQLEHVRRFDDELVKSRPWRTSVFRWSRDRQPERFAYIRTGIRQRLAERIGAAGVKTARLTARAEGRVFPELSRLAGAEPADLYIGHYPTGLAAAAEAAGQRSAALGYDVEDLYSETERASPASDARKRRVIDIEQRLVPTCRYVSAVSGPVAAEFARRYRTVPPVVVHNCHPWCDREILGAAAPRQSGPLSLYWFSQVIGLDRGLQDAIRAMQLAAVPVQLHLRGTVEAEVRRDLTALAESCGLRDAVCFHDRVAPEELLADAAKHDVGLALEDTEILNRDLTVTNKLFLYLTAGLAVIATDTAGQRNVLSRIPDCGALCSSGDVDGMAARLAEWYQSPHLLARAKAAALDAARTTWNAEAEGRKIVAAVEELLR